MRYRRTLPILLFWFAILFFIHGLTTLVVSCQKNIAAVPSTSANEAENKYKDIGQVAEAKIEGALETINESQSGTIYLVVKNKTDIPVTIIKTECKSPDFDLTYIEQSAEVLLNPQQTATFQIALKTRDSSAPESNANLPGIITAKGKHLLLFDTLISWRPKGQDEYRGDLISTYKIDVGVFGESEFLTLLGVPSILLLPGFLFLIILQILRHRAFPGIQKENQLTVKDPEFWLISVVLSIAGGFAYPFVTGLVLHTSRNYLTAYNFWDILLVGLFSLIAGFVFWVIWSVLEKIKNRMYQWRYLISEREKPAATLRKMIRNKMNAPKEVGNINGSTEFLFVVAETSDGKYVAPTITCEKITEATAVRKITPMERLFHWYVLGIITLFKFGNKGSGYKYHYDLNDPGALIGEYWAGTKELKDLMTWYTLHLDYHLRWKDGSDGIKLVSSEKWVTAKSNLNFITLE